MTRPTVLVGVGAGGMRMLASLADRISPAEDAAPTTADGDDPDRWAPAGVDAGGRFSFIAIDTDESALQSEPPDRATRIRLNAPESDAGSRPYLPAPPSIHNTGAGLRRRRVLARYYLEHGGNLNALRETLAGAVDEQATGEGGVDVWLLAGLAGGTGGGSLALLSAVIRDVAADCSEPVSTYVFGGLPAFDDADGTAGLHARNSYVTLKELDGLLPAARSDEPADDVVPPAAESDEAGGDATATATEEEGAEPTARNQRQTAGTGADYPVRFELPLTRKSLGRDRLSLSEPPLSGVFLARAASGDRVAAVEHAAVTTVLGHALSDGRPGIPFDDSTFGQDPGPPRYAAAAGGVSLPLADLDRLFSVRSEVRAAADQVADLEARIESVDADRDWLATLLDLDITDGWPGTDRIGDAVFHYPIRRVEDVDPERLVSGDTTVEAQIDSVVSEVGGDVPERIPTRPVVGLVLGTRLTDRLAGVLDEHPFPAELSAIGQEYREPLAEDAPDEADRPADPVRAWEDVVRPVLADHAASLTDAAADRLNPLASRRLRAEAGECREAIDRLDDRAAAHGALRDARDEAREAAREARERLRGRRDELESEVERLRRDCEGVRETLRETRRRRDDLRERLHEPAPDALDRPLPLENVSDLIPETLEFAESLAQLLSEGFLDEATVADALAAEIEALGRTVQGLGGAEEESRADESVMQWGGAATGSESDDGRDGPEADDSGYAGSAGVGASLATRLVMLTARPNRWGPAGDLLGLDPAGGADVPATLDASFDDRIGVDDGRGFGVDLLGLAAPADPTATGLLGTIDKRFRDPDVDVGDRLSDLSDTDIDDALAYPELVPDRERGAAQQDVAEAVADVEEEELDDD